MTWTTLFLGWWGIVSFFVTPVYLALNLANYLGTSEGPKGAANAPTPAAQAAPLGWAISSLVVAVLSFFLGIILGKWSFVGYLAAVVLGISALVKSRHAPSATGTRAISVLGIGCAALPLGFAMMFSALALLVATGPPGGSARSSGADAFDRANERLFAYDSEEGFGNNPEAKDLAVRLAGIMRVMEKIAFTGGRKDDTASLTKGHFLTHCEMREGKITFLVHVPELKNYAPDARKGLLDLAWTSAKVVTEGVRSGRDVTLAVGLRGILLYGASAVGRPPADPVLHLDGSHTDRLRPFFTGPEWPPVLLASTTPTPAATPSPVTLAGVGTGANPTPTPMPPAWASPASTPRDHPKAPTPVASPSPMQSPRLLPLSERVQDFARLVKADKEGAALARLREFKAMGREGAAAVPVLAKVGRDISVRASVQQESLRVLGVIGGAQARETLLLAISAKNSHEPPAATDGFSLLRGEDAAAVAPRLAALLEKDCPTAESSQGYHTAFCYSGLKAISDIGADAKGALPSLVRLVGVRKWASNLRHLAAQAVGSFGPAAKDAVPGLRDCLHAGPDESVAAVLALGKIGPAAIDAVPDLLRLQEAVARLPNASHPGLIARREMISVTISKIQGRP
jgi:hypothetical protein